MRKIISKLVFCLMIILSLSCEKERLNPLDPESKNYVKPSVEIVSGPSENEKVNSDVVTFVWKGNTDKNEFRYKLVYLNTNEVIHDWSPWSNVNTATFDYLDDGRYSFIIETRYKGNPADVTTFVRNWEIDAVASPAIKFYKLKNITGAGNEFYLEMWFDNIANVRGVTFTLIFDRNNINLVSISSGNLARTNLIQQVVLPDFNSQGIVNEVNRNGRVDITTGFISEKGLSGTGSILNFKFKALNKGNFNINAQNLIVIDPEKKQIQLSRQSANAVIQVN